MKLYLHMYQRVGCNLLQKNFRIEKWPSYKSLLLEEYIVYFFMFGVSLEATNSFFFPETYNICRSICVKKVIKLVAFIVEYPKYFRL